MGNWVTALGISEVFEGLVCCITTTATVFCSKSPTGYPRLIFSLIFLLGIMFSFLVLSPHTRQMLDKIPYLCTAVTTNEMCDNLVGYDAVYRICFSLSVFFVIFAILMLNTTSVDDFRLKIHDGYWVIKLVLLVLILIGAFHIPRHTEFGRAWMYVGLTGGFMFIIIQILLVIDFAHSWSLSWSEKLESGGNVNFWYTALALSTILIYSVAITMAVLFYLFFTDLPDFTKCRGNTFLITFNLGQCVLASFISVLPRIQEVTAGSGLLQSSIISLYTMYLTWCTLSNEPHASCNPLGDVILEYDKASGVNGQAVFECVLMLALLLFACNVRAGGSKFECLGISLSKLPAHQQYEYAENLNEPSKVKSKERNGDSDGFVEYNYSYFHFVMFLASLQLMMVVTNWHSPDELADMKKLVKNWATVWIQLSASFLCVLFYIWAMVMPLLVATWGSHLGLHYERVPTEDEEVGRLRKATMYARDDVCEEFHERTNFGKARKTEQTTTDSGMFDTNASTSHIRSLSRLGTRRSSSKATDLEDMSNEVFRRSEGTRDIALATVTTSLQVKDECDKDTEETFEQTQTRQKSEHNSQSNGSKCNIFQLRISDIKEMNDMGSTSEKNLDKQAKTSAIKTCKTVKNMIEEKRKQERASSRNIVKDQMFSENDSSRNLRCKKDIVATSSADDELNSSTSSRIKSINVITFNEKNVTKTTQHESLDEENDDSELDDQCHSRLSESDVNVRPSSKLNERSELLRTSSRLDERCSSRLSERHVNTRRATSRLEVENSTLSHQVKNDLKSSSENLEHSWNPTAAKKLKTSSASSGVLENDEIASENPHSVVLNMQQHIEWLKRLKKSGGTAINLRKEKVLINETKSEQSDEKAPQVLSLDDKQSNKNKKSTRKDVTDFHESREIGSEYKQKVLSLNSQKFVRLSKTENTVIQEGDTREKSLRKNSKVLSQQQNFHSQKEINSENSLESFEIITIGEVRQKTLQNEKDSPIFKHPFVSENVSNFCKREPQAPDVSKEILRLQAKIFKFQAKVVKTQQKILEIQENTEESKHSLSDISS